MAKFNKDSELWFEMNNFLTLVKYKLEAEPTEHEIAIDVFDHSDVSRGQGFHLHDMTFVHTVIEDNDNPRSLNFVADRIPGFNGIPSRISYQIRFGNFSDNLLDDEAAYQPHIKVETYDSLEKAAVAAVNWLLYKV